MTGGGSLLYGFDRLIENTVGIQTTIAQDPMSVVAIGTGCYAQSAAACKWERKCRRAKKCKGKFQCTAEYLAVHFLESDKNGGRNTGID